MTPRLRLRAWRSEDRAAVAAILGDPAVMEFSDNGALDAAEQAAWLGAAIAAGAGQGLPWSFAIERRAEGDVIGYVSLSPDGDVAGPDGAELGFRLVTSAWGQGFATEAVQAVVEAAGTARIVAAVDPENAGSLRVLKKLDLVKTGEVMLPGYDHPDHVYARSAP
ncbi:MAG: GNAT family N-acetyltransferase [Pseudomonadota bacterium]